MTTRAEVLPDVTVNREEALSVAGGLKPLQVVLALTSGLVGVLGTIVEIPVLAMFHAWKNLAFGRFVALEFVGDDHSRYVR
jgi:hypothetical protein